MSKFLTATNTEAELESMLKKARGHLIIISPYIKPNDNLLSRLTDAAQNNRVSIQMVCREGDLTKDQRAKLEQIPNLELLFNELVHAKCFYDDKHMVITSRNLYDKSSGNNLEMGVLLNATFEGDSQAFHDAKKEAEFIIRQSSPSKSTNSEQKHEALIPRDKVTTTSQAKMGYCIRCRNPIAFDRDRPYCKDDFKTLPKFHNYEDPESYCHQCGELKNVSRARPRCSDCFNENKGK
jgi:phosphatidylserine/phosphatidylglycerophosphate/cardiolipin synthase-like enzyme